MLKQIHANQSRLLPGLFKERADVNRSYLMELRNENLLQNFYLEACIRTDRDVTDMHLGWESPSCQLRGHFLGHWLSAAALLSVQNNDRELKAKLDTIIDELARCQTENGGSWIGSIPEKYFDRLADNASIWSPQYTVHKTLLGLYHSVLYTQNATARSILSHAADWYLSWTDAMLQKNPSAIYSGEAGGMLELWAGLYQLTDDPRFLTLAGRYSNPELFTQLLNGSDLLSNSHANASIPWAHGAAKMYEITGEERYLTIVQAFWKCAVTDRESFCTGGQNAGEFWIPPHSLGHALGERTQEFCTVYNMVRLADYLFRFTGDSCYLDYIEKNLYNGFLAQQNKQTGMPAYFLPLKAKSHKKWGSKTNDFWCCHGTTVQAHTLYPLLCWYEDTIKNRLVIAQYINATYQRNENVTVTQRVDMKYYNDGTLFDEQDNSQMSRWNLKITIEAKKPERFALSLRIPAWVNKTPVLTLNGRPLDISCTDGYVTLENTWEHDTITLYFPSGLSASSLSDAPELVAFSEGPVVLAGLCENDCGISLSGNQPSDTFVPESEHTYDTFPWQQSTYRTKNQTENFTLVPLYDVTTETYTVYFSKK